MQRLGIEYDLLPRESEILHLKFWDAAFELLKQRGRNPPGGGEKTPGCWVMNLASEAWSEERDGRRRADDDAKVIVRSNGTVTYVGKDIAYQMWKFGLLGRDFCLPAVLHLSGRARRCGRALPSAGAGRAGVWPCAPTCST